MAGAGAKKRVETNRQRLQNLRYALIVGMATFVIVRSILFSASTSRWHWIGFVLTSLVAYMTYSGIAGFAAPIYDSSGELVDGGADLSMKGMCGYYHDLLYITIFVQITASFTKWGWYTYLLIPSYGLWKLMENLVVGLSLPSMSVAFRKYVILMLIICTFRTPCRSRTSPPRSQWRWSWTKPHARSLSGRRSGRRSEHRSGGDAAMHDGLKSLGKNAWAWAMQNAR